MAGDFRADLVPCIDAARQCVDDLGLRTDVVEILTVQWSGLDVVGVTNNGLQLGAGTPSETMRTLVTPAPVVSDPEPRLVAQDPGKYAQGDRIISKVSRAYLRTDFPDAPRGTGGEATERYFLIDGDPYRMVGEPQDRNFEWVIHVRRMRNRPVIP